MLAGGIYLGSLVAAVRSGAVFQHVTSVLFPSRACVCVWVCVSSLSMDPSMRPSLSRQNQCACMCVCVSSLVLVL